MFVGVMSHGFPFVVARPEGVNHCAANPARARLPHSSFDVPAPSYVHVGKRKAWPGRPRLRSCGPSRRRLGHMPFRDDDPRSRQEARSLALGVRFDGAGNHRDAATSLHPYPTPIPDTLSPPSRPAGRRPRNAPLHPPGRCRYNGSFDLRHHRVGHRPTLCLVRWAGPTMELARWLAM